MENEIDKLPERPNCPTLLTLLLRSNKKLSTIHESFFDHIHGLYLRFCFKLRTLPPEIGKLARLEALDVRWTRIYSWPDEIGQLSGLVYDWYAEVEEHLGGVFSTWESQLFDYSRVVKMP